MPDTPAIFRRLRRQLAWVAVRTALMATAIWAGMATATFFAVQWIPAARVEWTSVWIPVAVFAAIGFLQGLLTCVWRTRAFRRRMAEAERRGETETPPQGRRNDR